LQAETELHNSRRNLQVLFDELGDFLFILDTAGRIRQVNPVVLGRLGYSLAELSGQPVTLVHPPERRQEATAIVAAMLAGQTDSCTIPLLTRSGELIPVETRITRGKWGNQDVLFGVSRDVSQRRRAEQALEESRRRYKAIFDQSPIAIEFYDAEGLLARVNQSCLEMFGVLDPEELEGFRLFEDPNITVAARQDLRKGKSIRFQSDFSFDLVRARGLYRTSRTGSCTLDIQIAPLVEGTDAIGYVAQVQDITARRRAEVALHESERKFRSLFERSADAMFLYDGHVFTDCNQAARDLMRCPDKEQLLHIPPAQLSPERQPDGLLSSEKAAALTAQAFRDGVARFEWVHRRFDGEDFPVEVMLTVIPVRGEQILFVVWRDIGERKQIETALRENEQRLQLVLEGSKDGFWDWTITTGAVRFSERWAEMLGYRLDEIEPHVREWEKLVHPDDLPTVTSVLRAHLDGRTPYYETEHRVRTKSGEWKWILDRGKVVERDSQGKPVRAAGTHSDISQRKEREAERERLIGELQDATAKIKTLRGLLPICSACKKIRDDAGYWNRLESYVERHTDAQFTHGLCPDCVQKYFADVFTDEKS